MNLTAYDKYKDLGVAWLGAIPQHWEVKRNKNIFTKYLNCLISRAFKKDPQNQERRIGIRSLNLPLPTKLLLALVSVATLKMF